jgi:hypothetical protein
VIRTIWFASFGLALVGGLFATQVMSSPIAERPTVASGPSREIALRDALTKSDQAAASRHGN